jgi:hypothetical protein
MDFIPFHRRPAVQTTFGLVFLAAVYLWALKTANQALSVSSILIDLALAAITLLLMIALASQFVLPVRTWEQRSAAFSRLLGYLVGTRGPVMFIREGRAIEAHGERERQGPGVLVVDSASAAVLRTDVKFTRAVGPGVVFTQAGERLAEALDLRRQVRGLGGVSHAANTPSTGQITSWALTQDGIPVATDLRITFMLDSGHVTPPREGRIADLTPFEFNPAAAERAVYGRAHADDEGIPWTDLPLRLAVELWRDQVKQRPLESLLDHSTTETPALETIQKEILTRLTSHASEVVGEDRRTHRIVNREFEVLYLRGVRVLAVNLYGLYLPREVRDERIRHWRERWIAAVRHTRLDTPGPVETIARTGETTDLLLLPLELTAGVRASLNRGDHPALRETVSLLTRDAWRVSSGEGIGSAPSSVSAGLEQVAKQADDLDEDCEAKPQGWKQ